eukprot:TRINITY_DN39504_c0_g1_i1.p2 TRINITY_DN39504_c0_g1~~TRINITY_DN39504_c0_g1_i1.p2  ORF type:complete len:138 (+),score=17.09 TRINITY_DN39504_c0_g1_i1:230-643(+)
MRLRPERGRRRQSQSVVSSIRPLLFIALRQNAGPQGFKCSPKCRIGNRRGVFPRLVADRRRLLADRRPGKGCGGFGKARGRGLGQPDLLPGVVPIAGVDGGPNAVFLHFDHWRFRTPDQKRQCRAQALFSVAHIDQT